jgi:hypothetical protein
MGVGEWLGVFSGEASIRTWRNTPTLQYSMMWSRIRGQVLTVFVP